MSQLPPPPLRVSMASSYSTKLALFRARFACRADVWSRRWTSARTGRSGWAPACGNEWRSGLCAKPAKGCTACRNRAWLPLTDDIIRWHLLGATSSGKSFALGGHPILPGDDCRFAALHIGASAGLEPPRTPRELSAASEPLRVILRVAKAMGAPATITSACDGNGFVLWWFFSSPVSASIARALVSACLTAARSDGAPIPFSAWDGIWPEQATLPVTGPGVPVPLPLSGEARRKGLGVFLDPATLAPRDDPWVALSEAPALAPGDVERVVESAQGRIYPVASTDRDHCVLPVSPEPRSPLRGQWSRTDGMDTTDAAALESPRPPRTSREISTALEPSREVDAAAPESPRPPRTSREISTALEPSREVDADEPSAFRQSPRVRGTLSDRLRIPFARLPFRVVGALEETAAFLSPVFDDAERMRRPVRGIPRIETHARIEAGSLSLPRGCLDAARAVFRCFGAELRVRDERTSGEEIDIGFTGTLRPAQATAGDVLLRHDFGVLEAGTAFGKTVLAAWMIARRGRSTLVLVNRRTLQRQWVARLAQFLGLRERDIGRIGGGARRATGRIDVALLQTLARRPASALRAMDYGFVIVDECHGLPADSFVRVTDCLRARFFLGLSATPVRRDGRHPVVAQQCGPVRHSVPALALAKTEPFAHIVLVRRTAFEPSETLRAAAAARTSGAAPSFSALCTELCTDEARNALLVADALASVAEGRSPVVLTDRREHVSTLGAALREAGAPNVFELIGGLRPKVLAAITAALAAVPPGEGRVLVATGPLLGEGFDDARLDTLLLATPLSWRGRLAQYAGRLHRRCEGKREVRIYDYADLDVPVLARMFDRRCEAYAAIGYAVRMPVNAAPGWPRDVAVPLDPGWNETYAESVRRLCADGADAPLAELFVRAAWSRPPECDAEIVRARSAAEAFLFRRLETLPATRGRFALNAALPIPFRGCAEMEVDFLCRDARLVVELDGAQHLEEVAYRRDREKDFALQRHGWLVLRFLAADVTVRLAGRISVFGPPP